tara:strand:- start:739 stop:1710 length:972 start_codon:yes stop_codon:yes gene_type:complete
MNRAIFFSKHLLDSIRDSYKVYKYFNLKRYNNFLILLKIFVIRFFYSFEGIRNRIKPKFPSKETRLKDNLFSDEKLNSYKIINDIDKKGYSETFLLKKKITDNILKESLDNDEFVLNKIDPNIKVKDLKILENENIDSYIKRLSSHKISRLTKTINLSNKKSELNKLIMSDEVLNIAKNYLNTKEISINASFFISNPLETSENEKYKNAQYFHWDNDFTKFVKLYIYLNDVNYDNGPHIFIPETHKFKKQNNKLCRLYSDINIENNYAKSKIFTGNAGSMFFVDSFGIHKGIPPSKSHRLMLNVHFGRGKILYTKYDKYIKLN